MSTIKTNLKHITPATMRGWIHAFVVDVGEEWEQAYKEAHPAQKAEYRAKADAAWRIAKGIRLGAFKPTRRR